LGQHGEAAAFIFRVHNGDDWYLRNDLPFICPRDVTSHKKIKLSPVRATKAYRESKGITPSILKPRRQMDMIGSSLRPYSLNSWERTPFTGWVSEPIRIFWEKIKKFYPYEETNHGLSGP